MRRRLLAPVLLALLAWPASAQAASVTAEDLSVRPGEGSPWSKGTLFKGQGFQVGATTSNGWAYGRAKGDAERCGWVLISQISSTTRTDDTCGSPKTEPLEDSEHVPGGGPSERWYVTCQSATLFGNYGGAAGNLRSATSTVTQGTPVGWRYTTGNGYAASIDGPTGTPRFILRSCISRTPPAVGVAGGGALTGPPPFTVLDEDELFELYGSRAASSAPRAGIAARGPVRVQRTRATIRIEPNNLIVANGLRGDRFTPGNGSCKGWVYGTITRRTTKVRHSGWVQAAGLKPRPRGRGGCGRVFPYKDRIGFVNAPSRSVTFRQNQTWTTTGSASKVYLRQNAAGTGPAADCTVHMNYAPGAGLQDPVGSPGTEKVFKNGDQSALRDAIGYRYTTADGAAALVTAWSGYRSGKRKVGMWGFVKRDCVLPLGSRGRSSVNTVYQSEIRICDRRVKPSDAVSRKRLNRGPKGKRIGHVSPCRLPNAATKPGRPAPDNPRDGWNFR